MPIDLPKSAGIGQCYQRNINLPSNLGYYALIWELKKVNKIIKSHSLYPSKLLISDIIQTVDMSEINPLHIHANDVPIIVADLPMLETQITIDGNHRIIGKQRNGSYFIKAYVLNPYLHTQSLTSNYMKLLFSIHHNTTMILKCCVGNIPLPDLEHHLLPVDFDLHK